MALSHVVCVTVLFLVKPFFFLQKCMPYNNSISFICASGEGFYHLDAPPIRVTGADIPMPYAKTLEDHALPTGKDVVRVVKKILNVS